MTKRIGFASALAWCAAAASAQTITSFETPQSAALLRPGGVKVQRVQQHATDGQWALRVVFPGSQRDTWPGLTFVPNPTDLAGRQMLAFDVYNPSDKTLYLSMRVDGANGRKIFLGQRLPAKKRTTFEVYVKDLGSRLGTTKIARFYPYVRMPREDVVLYFDHFRFARFRDRFTPWVYEETAPALRPTNAEQARGYVLFARHWLDEVFLNSRPRPGEREVKLQAFAAPGEFEPMTFSVRALRGLKQARVVVSDLRGPGGVIPAKEIAVYPVRCLNKRVTYSSNHYIQDMPVLLERRPAVDIPAGRSQRFWLDARVPEAAAPGVYEGTATFQADGAPPARLPVRLRVLPFKLAEPKRILGDYYSGPRLAKTPGQGREFLRRDLRDMRAHGATSVGLCIGIPIDQVERTKDGVAFHLDGSSLWEQFMDAYRDLKFPAPVVMLSDSGQAFAAKHSKQFMDAEYVAAYKAFWRGVQALCKRRGWPELIVQPVDEPGWKDRRAKDRNVALLKLLKQIPGMRTEQDGPGDAYFHKEAGPYADVWNYNGALGTPDQLRRAKAQGKLIMIYNCDVESYRPEIDRYVSGFFQRKAGLAGRYNWAYMSWYGSPYDDLDHKTGTWMHVYPAYGKEVGGPSIAWQGFREGVDDTRYAATLEQAVARARRNGNAAARRAADRAERTLKEILDSIAYSRRVRGRARWTRFRIERRGGKLCRIISGSLKLPNGWSFRTYDAARWRLASATQDVLAALGDIPAPRRAPAQAPAPAAGGEFVSLRWEAAPPPAGPSLGAVEQISFPLTDQPPKIDGDLRDPCWKTAGRITRFTLYKGGAPKQQTHVWLCADARNLYFAFKCFENNMGHITANVNEDGGRVWEDDCVEVFVDPALDRRGFRHIVVNSLGKQFWSDSRRPRWRARSVAAAKTYADAWTVELAVPRRDLGLKGDVFGVNLCRERRPTETLELSCWRPTYGKFGQPSRFGVARIGANFLARIDPGRPRLGRCSLRAGMTNPGPRPRRFVAALKWSQPGETQGEAKTQPFALAPGARRTVALTYRVGRADAPVRLRLELLDADTGRRAARYEMTLPVRPALAWRLNRSWFYLSDASAAFDGEVTLGLEAARAAALTFALRRRGESKARREQRVAPVKAGRLTGRLDVSGLPAGEYEAVVTLESAGRPLARETARLVRLRGPFD